MNNDITITIPADSISLVMAALAELHSKIAYAPTPPVNRESANAEAKQITNLMCQILAAGKVAK